MFLACPLFLNITCLPVISASPAANEPIIDVTQADGFQGVTGDFHSAVFATHPVCLAH